MFSWGSDIEKNKERCREIDKHLEGVEREEDGDRER